MWLREVVVVVAAAKRKKSKTSASHWGYRLAGIVLCAFFVLGVVTGLSRPGRILALRVQTLFHLWPGPGHSAIIPAVFNSGAVLIPTILPRTPGTAVALVQRGDAFYTLDSDGDLHGPVSPATQGDMPILSGPGALKVQPSKLIDFAEALVRAEATLGAVVSEMRIDTDDTATIYLEHPHIEVAFNLEHATTEFARALAVMKMWRGHENLIAALDLTTPGQAVMQMKPAAFANRNRTAAVDAVAMAAPMHLPHNRRQESARR